MEGTPAVFANLTLTVLAAGSVLLAAVGGGLGRRLAGSKGMPGGTQVGRAAWAVAVAVTSTPAALLAGAPWWLPPLIGAGFAVGLAVVGNSGMNVGRSIDKHTGQRMFSRPEWARGMLQLSGHGASVAALPAIGMTLFGVSPVPVFLAGLACPAMYELAWRHPLHYPRLGLYGDIIRGPYDPPPTAEVLWGALLAGVAAASLFLPR
jgi:hypothetical protein